MNYIVIIILLVISYLIGSIPSGYIIGKSVKGIDIRTAGSKSTGATNTMRLLGLKYGILVMVLDTLKAIPVIAVLGLLQLRSYYVVSIFGQNINILGLYGIFAVIGHIFPIYLGFKGGKAVATSFGVVLALLPFCGIAGLVVFALIASLTKYVSLASMIAAIMVMLLALLNIFAPFDITFDNGSLEYFVTIIIMVTIIILRHRSNIKRLKIGTEHKIG